MIGEPFKEAWKTWEAIRCEMDGLLHGSRSDSKERNSSLLAGQGAGSQTAMTVRELMTPEPLSVRVETPLHRALDLLIRNDLSALPVVDENDGIVGLLNERHLLTAFGDPEATSVAAVMDIEPVTVAVDEPIVEVVDRLMVINVRQVLVLQGWRLVGVVTRADLMPAIFKVLQERAQRAHQVSLIGRSLA